MLRQLRRAAGQAAGVLLPLECAACGAPDASLCAACRAQLRRSLRPRVDRLLLDGLPVVSAAPYRGVAAALVRAVKLRGRVDAAAPLGGLLRVSLLLALRSARWGRAEGAAPLLLAPVPSRAAAERRRGTRHLAELSLRAVPAARLGRPLRLLRPVEDQHGLGAAGRERNLAGAMRASRGVRNRAVVVIDDVVTSGASVREAVRALREAGAQPIAVASATRAGG